MTPQHLLDLLPEHLDSIQEAEELLAEAGEDIFSVDPDYVYTFNSYTEAFRELYPGDIDEFKRVKCEDYECLFSDFSEFYEDWLAEKYTCYQLSNNKILIID
jgi:hypothetical protein